MKTTIKISVCVLLITGGYVNASAQSNSSNATQTTNLSLDDAIDISMVNGTSNAINTLFTSTNSMRNGVETAEQDFKVRSNKNFKVVLNTNAATFTYSGSSTNPNIAVNGKIKVKVEKNQTGGQKLPGYNDVTIAPMTLISDGERGENQTFSVKYMLLPGATLPAGTYSVDVVYTATQM